MVSRSVSVLDHMGIQTVYVRPDLVGILMRSGFNNVLVSSRKSKLRNRYHFILKYFTNKKKIMALLGPRQANLVLVAYASSEGSGEPAHPRSLARTSATRSYKQ